MPGQLFPLDTADKNIGLTSSEMIYAILGTIIQKRWDRTAGGTGKDSKKISKMENLFHEKGIKMAHLA